MTDEVAVFIDFENLRYGLLNRFGQEPDPSAIVEKAKKYGRPSVMRAYADFTEHPPEVSRVLQVAGIEAISTPVKRKTAGTTVRITNAADMVLALDAVVEAIDADSARKVKTFLLVTGDADYVRLATLLRNRFGQEVVIVGVPGAISHDLELAAGKTDHLEVNVTPPAELRVVKTAIVAMVRRGPSPLEYWSVRIIDQWVQDARQAIPGNAKERRDAIAQLLQEGALVQSEVRRSDGRTVKEATLNEATARQLGYL